MNSYAVGPRVDAALGMPGESDWRRAGRRWRECHRRQVGGWLAAAVQTPVVWPKTLGLPNTLQAVSGKRALPLRYDRDTILVGKGHLTEPTTIKMTADADGQSAQLDWQLKPSDSNTDFAFLAPLVTECSATAA